MKLGNVLITGGAGSTGFAVADRFAREGISVTLTSRDPERARRAAGLLCEKRGGEHIGLELDQADESSVTTLYDRLAELGRLPDSIVLSAADLGLGMDPLECRVADFAAVISTNIVGAFSVIREGVSRKMKTGGGSVVIIGSNMSRRAIKNRSAYIASKGGLVSLAKALAIDFAQYGVRVNTLLSGSIHTDRWDCLDDGAVAAKRARIPLGIEAFPDDIAEAVYFLASDRSGCVTGSELVLDGGTDAQLFPGV